MNPTNPTAADVMTPPRRTTSDHVTTIKESLGEIAGGERERVLTRTREARARLDQAITQKPIQSLAIAAGVGLVLGLLLGRRR